MPPRSRRAVARPASLGERSKSATRARLAAGPTWAADTAIVILRRAAEPLQPADARSRTTLDVDDPLCPLRPERGEFDAFAFEQVEFVDVLVERARCVFL